MIRHVIRRELAALWVLLPASIVIGALAMIAIASIGHVRGDADGIMNGTWVATLVVSTIVGMSLLGEDLSNSRLSFYFARPFSPSAIFGGKVVAGVLLALFMQVAIVVLVALALPELSWRGSTFAQRSVVAVVSERLLSTVGCTLLGMAGSIALGSKTRWIVVDVLGLIVLGILGTWFAVRLEPNPGWLTAESIRTLDEKALFHAMAFLVVAVGLGAATARSFAHGRTDRMRAHRTLSTTLWPIAVPSLVLVVVVGEATTPGIPVPPALAKDAIAVPPVTRGSLLAYVDGQPLPYLLVPDTNGTIRVGAAASWADFDARRIRFSKPSPIAYADRFLRFRYAEGTSGSLSVASIPLLESELPQQALQQQVARTSPSIHDRKMKQDEARARMFSELSTSTALAYIATSRGTSVNRSGPWYPHRSGRWYGMGQFYDGMGPLLLAGPTTTMQTWFDLQGLGALRLAVSHAGKIRPLRLGYMRYDNRDCSSWVEVRVSSSEFVVEVVPGTPITVTRARDVAPAIAELRGARGGAVCPHVDVLVDPQVEVQRWLEVVVALEAAGERSVTLGKMPDAVGLALRGRPISSTTVALRSSSGEGMPYYEYSGYYERENFSYRPPTTTINRCYDNALVRNPALEGTMNVRFSDEIDRNQPMSVVAVGVEPALAECVAEAFRTLTVARPFWWYLSRLPSQSRSTYGYKITFYP